MTGKISLFALIIMSNGISASNYQENLCTPKERPVAACYINGKILSFCASSNAETINYRYGRKSKIEINIPFTKNDPMYRWRDVATYTTYLGFRRSAYSYSFGIPQETLEAKAFLEIFKNNSPLARKVCSGNSIGEKSITSEAIIDVRDTDVRDNNFIFPPNSTGGYRSGRKD